MVNCCKREKDGERYREGTNGRKIVINSNYDGRRCYLIQRCKRVAVVSLQLVFCIIIS